jgi:hypothetical protein
VLPPASLFQHPIGAEQERQRRAIRQQQARIEYAEGFVDDRSEGHRREHVQRRRAMVRRGGQQVHGCGNRGAGD